MKGKIWHQVKISTDEQDVLIYPTEDFDGIIVEAKELDGKTSSARMYLNEAEMELMILKMREMMAYIKSPKSK